MIDGTEGRFRPFTATEAALSTPQATRVREFDMTQHLLVPMVSWGDKGTITHIQSFLAFPERIAALCSKCHHLTFPLLPTLNRFYDSPPTAKPLVKNLSTFNGTF